MEPNLERDHKRRRGLPTIDLVAEPPKTRESMDTELQSPRKKTFVNLAPLVLPAGIYYLMRLRLTEV